MTPLEWVGAIVAVLVGIGIAAAGAGFLWSAICYRLDSLLWKMAEHRIRQRAQHMRHQRWWWDTPEKAAVWLACAEHMADGGYPDVQIVRDQTYRRMLAELLAEKSAP